jgi:hypothetical protein
MTTSSRIRSARIDPEPGVASAMRAHRSAALRASSSGCSRRWGGSARNGRSRASTAGSARTGRSSSRSPSRRVRQALSPKKFPATRYDRTISLFPILGDLHHAVPDQVERIAGVSFPEDDASFGTTSTVAFATSSPRSEAGSAGKEIALDRADEECLVDERLHAGRRSEELEHRLARDLDDARRPTAIAVAVRRRPGDQAHLAEEVARRQLATFRSCPPSGGREISRGRLSMTRNSFV